MSPDRPVPFIGVRRFPRRVRAALGYRHVLLEGWTSNLSMGGAFVETRLVPLPPDSKVTVRLEIPSAPEPLVLDGEVRWSRAAGANEGGVGLRFERLDEVQANLLYRYLQPPRAGVTQPPPRSADGDDGTEPDYLEYRVMADGVPQYMEINLPYANTDRVWPPHDGTRD